YGDANPTFEYEVSGAALEGTPEITCEATATSPVGTYPIVIKKGSVANYNDTYVNGTLTITKAPLAVKVENATREQYVENPEFVITYTGWKLNDDESVLAKKPTATTTATKDSPVGEYEILVSGGEAKNYDLNYENGILTVIESTGIATISVTNPVNVYNVQGRMVCAKATTLSGLPSGVYIVNGKKVVVK
ncbi:MAG: peptidase C10 family protein, partial [Prevotella sp.]|nr:peptidase C10 family protein [Prevotella sp.]